MRERILKQNGDKYQLMTDGNTVWVNDSSGCCIGRLTRFGIDVHTTAAEQRRGERQCLDCRTVSGQITDEVWQEFRVSMKKHHSLEIPRGFWRP